MIRISRRALLSGLAAGAAGAIFHKTVDAGPVVDPTQSPDSPKQRTEPHIKKYNELGKTGIEVSDVIFGAGALYEPALIRYAYDRGVNAFDTAAGYSEGLSEEDIGNGLKGVREKCVIITKQGFSRRDPFDRKEVIRTLETSLKKLQSDYVDGLFIHSMDTPEALNNDELIETFLRFKEEGKVRFTGFSTHDEDMALAECVKPKHEPFVDAVMLRYNHIEGGSIEPLIAQANKKGIGTIAMKTLAGGKHDKLKEFVGDAMSYPQAAVAWVLSNRHIDCAVLSMDNYSLIDAYVGASGKRLERNDQSLLRKYRDAVGATYCRVRCAACERACPHGVSISDVMRYKMYFEDYGQEKKAITQYAAHDAAQKPTNCQNCSGACTIACPYGLRVQEQLVKAHQLLTV
jgi:hypothetical protein